MLSLLAILFGLTALDTPAFAQAASVDAVVLAVQDCVASVGERGIDQKKLKKLGWSKAKMEGNLERVVTPYVRKGAPPLLVLYTSCIAKFQFESSAVQENASLLTLGLNQALGVEPVVGEEGKSIWRLPTATIEFVPGPADGSNVSVAVKIPRF